MYMQLCIIFCGFRYVRVLGALYLRIVGTSIECYKYLEPLLNDYRKLKFKNRQGSMWINGWMDGQING